MSYENKLLKSCCAFFSNNVLQKRSDVWIGVNAATMPSVSIGEFVIVGTSNTAVTKNVPAKVVVIEDSPRQFGPRV